MKRIIKAFRKMRSKVTIGVNKQPFLFTLGMLLAANILILFVAAGIALAIGNEAYGPDNYLSALVDAALWLVVPNHALSYLGYHIGLTILGVTVTVIGIVLFMGVIIALTTNYIRNYIAGKSAAQGKLDLSDHYIILNYNDKVPALLVDSMHNDVDDTFLILSDKTKEYVSGVVQAELAASRKKPVTKLKMIIRKGNPYYATELNDISVHQAKGVLIFHDDQITEKPDGVDLDVVRLLMAVAECDLRPDCQVVVETRTGKTRTIVDDLCRSMPTLASKKIAAYSYNRKLGQFLANSVLCPELTPVMYDILSFDGSTFYQTEQTPCADFLANYGESLPVVVNNKTFAMAYTSKDVRVKRSEPFTTDKRLAPSTLVKPDIGTLYIIGTNRKLDYMMASLVSSKYKPKIRTYKTDERKDFVAAITADTGTRTAVILSDDNSDCDDDNVFLTLIELADKFGLNPPFKIVAEIFDPKKQRSIELFNVRNVIISNRVVSFFALQLLVSPGSGDFFEEMFSQRTVDQGKFDLWVDDAKYLFEYADGADKHVFDSYAEFVSAAYHGSGGKIMPLGFSYSDRAVYFSCEGLDKVRDVAVKPDDKIVYIVYK